MLGQVRVKDSIVHELEDTLGSNGTAATMLANAVMKRVENCIVVV